MPWPDLWYRTPQGAVPAADAVLASEVALGQQAFVFVPDVSTGVGASIRVVAPKTTVFFDSDDTDVTPVGNGQIHIESTVGGDTPEAVSIFVMSNSNDIYEMDYRGAIQFRMSFAQSGETGMIRVVGHL
jgi:hypothetical protein